MKLLLTLCLIATAAVGFSQPDTIAPTYKRFPVVPPFNLLLTDSVTHYTKADLPRKTAALLMVFNPDCEHCQHEADELYARREELRNVQILMATNYPLPRVKKFITEHHLQAMKNVVVTLDPDYFLITFFSVHNLPFMAAYDKKGKLVTTFEGSQPIEKILAAVLPKK